MSGSSNLLVVQIPGIGPIALPVDAFLEARQEAHRLLRLQSSDAEDKARPDLLTCQEMAEVTHTPESWWAEAARNGKVPSIQIGKYRRFDREDVIQHLRHAD